MGLTHFPNGLSSFGIPLLGNGGNIPSTTGTYFFVDSATGLSSNAGTSPDKAMATIDQAINKCTANKGDVIIVMPHHAETVAGASGITLDVAGVQIIGLGVMNGKPTLSYSATTSTMVVSAENCRVSNLKFESAIDSLASFLTLSADDIMVDNCDFEGYSTLEFLNAISITTTYDNFVIRGCTFKQPTDPAGTDAAAGTGVIYCVDTEGILIEDCLFKGLFETAIVHNKTTKVQDLVLKNCTIMLDGPSTAVPLELVAASTGMMANCNGYTLLADDVTEAKLFGTLGINFWINNTHFGNDSGGGGQQGVGGTAAT